MRRSTVLLADDHAIVAEGLARLLKDHDFEVVGTVGDGTLLIDAAKRLRPDVIVTDLSMPGLSGLDVLARLKAEGIDSKVIVLTMHNDANLATVAMRGGAAGYLLKESAGDELVAAIRQALQGRVYLTPALTKEVMERMSSSAEASEPQLTPRQRDVLRLIVKGQRMKEIAANLGLSTRTVETHKYEMMETLGLHSTAELVQVRARPPAQPGLSRRHQNRKVVPIWSWRASPRWPSLLRRRPQRNSPTMSMRGMGDHDRLNVARSVRLKALPVCTSRLST